MHWEVQRRLYLVSLQDPKYSRLSCQGRRMHPIEHALADLEFEVGQEVGVSDWVVIDQPRIDAFAAATLDTQWIHTDPERAAQTPFGGTIAHGFLTLSLGAHFADTSVPRTEGAVMNINYGFEKIRFVAPVPVNARIRGRFQLESVQLRKPTELMRTHVLTIEIEGNDKPALVATWSSIAVFTQTANEGAMTSA